MLVFHNLQHSVTNDRKFNQNSKLYNLAKFLSDATWSNFTEKKQKNLKS